VAAVAEVGAAADAPGLAARAGVVTGEVAVTLGAVGEGMVAGDAVNTAARVQSAAEPGQVLVDGATYRLAGSAVGFADTGEHRLKGKADPVLLWRATRVLAGVGGSQRVDGLEAPLTGRDAELRTIKELFHAAAERRVPRMVLVSGPAGTGKSRLGWEFRKYIDGLAADVWWHRGRCLSYGEGVAFWALAEMVRQRLGIAEEDSADVAAGKLAAGLDRFVPDPGERAYVGVRLGRLLGVGSAEDAAALSREELFAGWRLFFERLAAESPVVLLVEDAQYADGGLLDFLDHLVDWARNLPIYVLVFARPELGQTRPRFGAGRNRVTLTLDPLDDASMDKLVDALVPGMAEASRSKVTRQAQGVPLFAVETVRSLVDRDIVQPVEGVYRLVGDIGELAVPHSLHALLAARLDALDPGVRRLVADAAVLGTTFPAEALIAISGRDEPSVRAALADLVRREVLSVSADPLSPERGSYQFAQDMLRQVAYDTLSRRDRKTRHLAVAAHLRQAFPGEGEEVTDVIARHYLDALHAIADDQDTADIRGQAALDEEPRHDGLQIGRRRLLVPIPGKRRRFMVVGGERLAIHRSAFDLGKIRDRPRRAADFVEQFQAVLAHLWVVIIDLDLVEEGIHRRTQPCRCAQGAGKIFLRDGSACFRLQLIDRFRQRRFLGEAIERGIGRAVKGPLVLLLLDRENIAGALGAGEQVLAVVGVEEFSERLDATDDHQEIVLAFEREHGVHEIVPRALVAELDFQAVGEEGEEITRNFQADP